MKFFIFTIIIWLFCVESAYAGSTALSRSSFAVSGEPGAVTTETLLVSNISPAGQSYQFNLSGLDDKTASILPRQFWLAPGGEQTVVLRFRAGSNSREAHIDLLSYDSQQTSNFKIAQGIKIPVRFSAPAVAGAQTSVQPTGMPFAVKVWTAVVYALDLSLFFVVFSLYYQRRHKLWQQARAGIKINFL